MLSFPLNVLVSFMFASLMEFTLLCLVKQAQIKCISP